MKLGEIARVCGALPICRRKVRHTTAEAAAQHLREVEAKHGHIARLKIYSCPLCLGFHVGKARRWP